MKFLHCALYLAVTGIIAFLVGRIVPKSWFQEDRFPYRSYPVEQKLYRALRVKKWQSKVPDMSRIFPFLRGRDDSFSSVSERPRLPCDLAGSRRYYPYNGLYPFGKSAVHHHSAI